MITENLSILKIHKLTQAQYQRELEAGRIDQNALYLTPDEETDLSGYDDSEVRGLIQANSDAIDALENSISNDIWGDIDALQSDVALLDSRVSDLENNICLIAGTQILMADGTTKPIEEVCEGDMLKSWDIDNNTYVDVRCVMAMPTGQAQKWQMHVFDNGSILTIYDNHGIYSKTRGCPWMSKSWSAGDIAIGLDGAETEYCNVVERKDSKNTKKYNILTDNNLYFANGILCGHAAHLKMAYYNKGRMALATEEDITRYQSEADIYNTCLSWEANPEYLVASSIIKARYNKANQTIATNKKNLASLDYKTIKRLQGKLSDEEWNETILDCENCREIINQCEAEKITLNNELKAVRENLGIIHSSSTECFKACYDMDMEYIKSHQ